MPLVRLRDMDARTRRWLVPLAAAVAVLAVVAVVWQQRPGGDTGAGSAPPAAGGSAVPGSPGSEGTEGPDGDLTPVPGPDQTPAAGTQAVDSYFAYDATRLALNYTTGVPECYGTVGEPVVEETAEAVTVTLPKTPPKDARDVVCIDIALTKSVDIELDTPLGDREVRDGSRGDTRVEPGAAPGDEGQVY
jgi:hypothetical protein